MQKLKKEIGTFGVFSIATGAMISSGIFILPSLAFSKVGPAVFISYFAAGLLGMLGILSMIELSTAMPKAGGDYFFINKTFGPLIGSVSGFLGWFALSLKSSFAIYGISGVIGLYLDIDPAISGLVLCLIFVVLNIIGAKESAVFQTLLVVILLGLMTAFVVAGVPAVDTARFRGLSGTKLNTVLITSGFIFISFGGLLKVANVAEEVKNPRKSLPRGMIISILVVTVLYTTMTFIMTGVLEPEVFRTSVTPVADAASKTMGTVGYLIITIASVLAFITTANAGILAASRYPLALSADRLIPSGFGKLGRKKGTPVPAIIITGALIYGSLFLPLETLVKAASTVILTSYVLTNLAVIIFRESRITNYSPSFRAPLYPAVQIVSIILFSFFIIDLGLSAIEMSMVLLAVGVIVYIVYGRRHAGRESALLHLMRRIINERLVDENIEDEFREILISRDNIEQDNFDVLLKSSTVSDIEGSYDFDTLVRMNARKISAEIGMPEDEIVNRFIERQAEVNTALSPFLAIPHIVIDGEERMFMHVIRTKDGTRFSDEESSVKAVFLLGGTKDRRMLHLKTIAAIASLISQPDFEQRWNEAASDVELKNLLVMNERKRYY